ncbi:MAG: hypothetical protein H6722_02595 [Sandaracinus sp.]|nr:hypothetical protein [Sandaracinus sp.]
MEKLQELGIDLDRVDETLAQLEEAARSTVLGRNSAPPSTPGEEEEELDADELLDDEPTGVHDLRQIADAFEQDPSQFGEKAELAQMLRAESKPKAEPKASQGIQILRAADGMPIFYRPVGCEACSHTGYRGRLGIFELMLIDGAVRAEILKQSDSKTIARAAQASGMRVLRDDGARQVLAGVTSVEEVLAATQEAGD